MGASSRDSHARAATLHDVAQRAGVAVSTASRALTGRRRVSPRLVRRVQSAASALDYSPNVAARSLRLSRTMTLGLIVPKVSNPGFFDFLEGVSSGIEEHGYSLMVTVARGDPHHYRTLIERLHERRMDGIFLVTPPEMPDTSRALEAADTPTLALWKGPASLPLLTSTEEAAIGRAVERLAELGHRRILYLGLPESVPSIRVTWLEQAAHRAGLAVTAVMIPHRRPEQPLQACIEHALAGPDGATALFVDLGLVPALMHLLTARGLRVPADVSLIAFGESPWTLELGLPLASISHTMQALGTAAAAVMIAWLKGERPAPLITVGAGEWIERASIGPAARASRQGIDRVQ